MSLREEAERIALTIIPDGRASLWPEIRIVMEGMRVALDAAMAECEAIEKENWHAYKRAPISDARRANPHYQGLSDGAGECADRIRKLREELK